MTLARILTVALAGSGIADAAYSIATTGALLSTNHFFHS